MAVTYPGERVEIQGLAEASEIERLASAITHEFAVAGNFEPNAYMARLRYPKGTEWTWVSLMNRELAAHLAFVGEEDAARIALERTSPLDQSDRFQARFSIWRAFRRPEDHALLREETGNNPNIVTHSDQMLEVVSNDVAEGIDEDLAGYVEKIPRVAERTIGQIMLAGDPDKIVELRDAYKVETDPIREKTSLWSAHCAEADLISVSLAAAVMGANTHDTAMELLTSYSRPDTPKAEIRAYLEVLLESGERDKVEDVITAVTRHDGNNSYKTPIEIVVADITHEPEDIARARESASGAQYPGVRDLYYNRLVGVHVDTGDLDAAEELTKQIDGSMGPTSAFEKKQASLELFRGYLNAGDLESAEQAYHRAVYGGKNEGTFAAARLMLARYLRTGNSGPVNLTH